MLKRLSTLILAVAVAASAMAQTTITKKTDGPKMVVELTQVSGLIESGGTYFILMVTNNRYDDPVLIELGKDYETCIQTLDGLGEAMDGAAKGESYTITDVDDVPYSLRKVKYVDCVVLSSSTRAGEASLHRAALKRARKWFDENK